MAPAPARTGTGASFSGWHWSAGASARRLLYTWKFRRFNKRVWLFITYNLILPIVIDFWKYFKTLLNFLLWVYNIYNWKSELPPDSDKYWQILPQSCAQANKADIRNRGILKSRDYRSKSRADSLICWRALSQYLDTFRPISKYSWLNFSYFSSNISIRYGN